MSSKNVHGTEKSANDVKKQLFTNDLCDKKRHEIVLFVIKRVAPIFITQQMFT